MMKKVLIVLCLCAVAFGINKKYIRPQVNTVGLVAHWKLWDGSITTGTDTELVTDGDFPDGTNWSLGIGWSIAAGVASCDGNQTANSYLIQTDVVVENRTYKTTYTVSNRSAGIIKILCGNTTSGTIRNDDGTYSETLVATGVNSIYFRANADFVGDIDNVSVKDVTPYVFDYSLNGNQGTVSGALPKFPGFFFDGAAGSSQDDYISVAADETIDANDKTALSISAWIYPQSDGEGDAGRIMEKGYLFYVINESGTTVDLRFELNMSGTNVAAYKTGGVTLNQWNHIIAVYNEDSALKGKLYINGDLQTLDANTAGTGAPSDDSADDLYIGDRLANDRVFDGKIDDVMIFKTAKTAAEVKSIYEVTKGRYSK